MPTGPLRVLIVEDEALLAMDIEAMVEDSGHAVVGEAASLSEVHDLGMLPDPDLAFVDIHLAEGSNGLDVSAFIHQHWPQTAVVFVTANPNKIPADFCGAYGVIPKPFSRSGLMSAMRYIAEGLNGSPTVAPPRSFVSAPRTATMWKIVSG